MQQDFAAVAASEKDVAEAIGRLRDDGGYLMDPHTACGVVAAERALGPDGATPQIVLFDRAPGQVSRCDCRRNRQAAGAAGAAIGAAHSTRALRRDR